jgi:hypothetical protein
MEITFRKRPFKILYVFREDKGDESQFLCEQLTSVSPENICVYKVPSGEIEKKESLENFASIDPDFVIYSGLNFAEIKGFNISPFSFLSVEAFQEKYSSFLISSGNETRKETTIVYPEPDEALKTGKYYIPNEFSTPGILEVKFSDNAGKKHGYNIPPKMPLKKIIRDTNQSFPIRISSNYVNCNFVLLLKQENTQFFYLPPTDRIIPLVFQTMGYSVRATHKKSLINLFKNIEEAGKFFTRSFSIPLMSSLASGSYRHFGALRKMIAHNSNLEEPEISKALLQMTGSRLLLRGYILTCEYCKLTDFYGMKEVDERFLCKGCYETNITPLKLDQAFKLNHIASESYHQGSIATILTLYYLYREAKESFIYSTELSLKKMGKEMEIDIACLVDGKMVIGEAKMGKLIKDRDFSPKDEFNKYKGLSGEIHADQVIFSTVSEGFYDVPRSKIDRFKRELEEEGMGDVEVRIFSGKDLLH